jgi:hypothetical protein
VLRVAGASQHPAPAHGPAGFADEVYTGRVAAGSRIATIRNILFIPFS